MKSSATWPFDLYLSGEDQPFFLHRYVKIRLYISHFFIREQERDKHIYEKECHTEKNSNITQKKKN
jgi:hypothetical protein